MTESFLLALFKRNINFKKISIERNDQYSEEIILFIINHLTCLEYLNISSKLTYYRIQNANFKMLYVKIFIKIKNTVSTLYQELT